MTTNAVAQCGTNQAAGPCGGDSPVDVHFAQEGWAAAGPRCSALAGGADIRTLLIACAVSLYICTRYVVMRLRVEKVGSTKLWVGWLGASHLNDRPRRHAPRRLSQHDRRR